MFAPPLGFSANAIRSMIYSFSVAGTTATRLLALVATIVTLHALSMFTVRAAICVTRVLANVDQILPAHLYPLHLLVYLLRLARSPRHRLFLLRVNRPLRLPSPRHHHFHLPQSRRLLPLRFRRRLDFRRPLPNRRLRLQRQNRLPLPSRPLLLPSRFLRRVHHFPLRVRLTLRRVVRLTMATKRSLLGSLSLLCLDHWPLLYALEVYFGFICEHLQTSVAEQALLRPLQFWQTTMQLKQLQKRVHLPRLYLLQRHRQHSLTAGDER